MRTTKRAALIMVAALTILALRCEKDTGTEEGKPDTTVGTGKEDAWNYENDPTRFNVDVIYKIAELPANGNAAQMPWSETWWPMRKDGFNQRWQGSGTLSPLEKYDQAFNGWTPPEGFMALRPFSYPGAEFDAAYYDQLGPAAKYESQNGGNAQARNGRDDDSDGESDESDWDGLGSWWGKCHMWSGVSILVPEPKRAVEYHGIRFEYSDLTALAMESYFNRAKSYMLGGRCNTEEVARDAYGRATNDECRDTNAGSFHVIVANMLGRHQRAFVMDASSDFQVWNHPVTDYRVDSQAEVTLQKALELLGRTDVTTYPYNPDAKAFYEVNLTLGYATDGVSPSTTPPHGNVRTSKAYHYLLELDGNGSIIGGEWLESEGYPDFFWLPVMSNYARGGNPNVKFSEVQMLIEMATRTEDVAPVTEGEIVVENTTPLDIPDNTPAGVARTIDVSDTAAIASLKVRVDITHTYIGDLTVELRHGGKAILLHNQAGGSTDNLKEEYTVPDFVGGSVSGSWELFVADKAGSDTGRLNSWALVYAPGDGSSTGTTTTTVTHASTTAVNIPDNKAEGVTSVIGFPETGKATRAIVNVDITHTYIGDLTVELRHAGTSFALHKRTGGSNDNIVKEFTLSDFNNVTVTGDWTLFISDTAGRDVGKLNSWSVKLEVAP